MQDRLNSLLEKHCETIKSSVTALGRLLEDVETGASDDPLAEVQAAEAIAHQLKGSSGTAGFKEVSRAATELDDRLKELSRGGTTAVTGGIDGAMKLFHYLDRVTSAIRPDSSSLYHQLDSQQNSPAQNREQQA